MRQAAAHQAPVEREAWHFALGEEGSCSARFRGRCRAFGPRDPDSYSQWLARQDERQVRARRRRAARPRVRAGDRPVPGLDNRRDFARHGLDVVHLGSVSAALSVSRTIARFGWWPARRRSSRPRRAPPAASRSTMAADSVPASSEMICSVP